MDDSRIPPSGVTIQCPKCSSSFVVKREAQQGAVPLPGSAGAVPLPGTRGGGVVPLPGSVASGPAPSHTLDALDFGLDDDLHGPKGPSKGGGGSSAGMLDFIDQVATKAGVQSGPASGGELRVRRLNGQVEGPFGLQRLLTLVKNGEFDDTCQISPDGRTWKSMTTHPELARAYSQRSQNADLPGLPDADDLPGLVSPRGGRPSIPGFDDLPGPSTKAKGGSLPGLEDFGGSAPRRAANATLDALDLDGGLDFEDALPTANLDRPAVAAKKAPAADGEGGGPSMAPDDEGGLELDSDRGKKRGAEDPYAPPGGAPAAPKMAGMVDLGDVPTSPPIWVEYRKMIIAFAIVIALAITALVTAFWMPEHGPLFIYDIIAFFEPPPPPPPEAPKPPPPKIVDVQQIQALLDSGTFEGFRSVIATVKDIPGKVPENQLALAKAYGLAGLAYGTGEFPLTDLEAAVEALNKLDLTKVYDGNTAKANLEIIKARMALEILKDQAPSAAGALASAAEQASGDKEIHFLLGLARSKLGETVGAIDAFDKALVVDSRYAPALFATGKMLEDPEDQLEFYRRAVLFQPNHALAALAAADAYAAQNRAGYERRMLELASKAAMQGVIPAKRPEVYARAAKVFAKTGRIAEAREFAEKAHELQPANADYVLTMIEAQAESKDGKKALASVGKVLTKQDARNFKGLIARARAYMASDDFGKAFEDLQQARVVSGTAWQPLYWEGVFSFQLGKYDAARDAFVASMTKEAKGEDGALALIALGRLELDEGNVQKTFELAQKALEFAPSSIDALALLGKCQRLRGELDKAKDTFEKVLHVDPDNLDARIGMANALRDVASRFPQPALRPELGASMPIYIAALVEQPNNSEVLFEYGRALTLDGRLGAALDLYGDATALNAKDVRPFTSMVAAYMSLDPVDLPNAKKRLESASLIDPYNPEVQFWKGRIYFAEGHYDDAEKSFEAALRKESKNAMYHYWYGKTFGKQDRLFEQIREFQEALRLNERYAAARRGLGDAEFDRNNFISALDHYRLYQAAAPEDLTIFRDFARCWTGLNKSDESLKAWQDVLRHFPADNEALMQVGKIYSDMSKFDLALKAFKTAMQHDKSNGDALCQYALTAVGGAGRIKGQAKKDLQACIGHPNAPEDSKEAAKQLLDSEEAMKHL
ncbi:MAG: tetratricopeptide repeat protein [Deltaproteobacteria bacterium]|nr:tetratricopeptide repeat protein [Deltaproteobacteria bacterium]